VALIEKQARALVEQQHDYAGAAQLLQKVSGDLLDEAFYKEVCAKRDRVAQLDQEIHDEVDKGRLNGLRPKVAELVQLQPQRKDLRALLKTLPQESAKEITNSIGLKLVLIPRGTFLMGSPKTEKDRFDDENQHEVEITKAFFLGKYEVTRGQFAQFVQSTGYQTAAEKDGQGGWGFNAATGKFEGGKKYNWRHTGWGQTDEHPVVNVNWNDARAFCDWLSKKEGKLYRLPTEAQWEYACRAGTTTSFYNGDDAEGLTQVGNVADAAAKAMFPEWTWPLKANDGYAFTAPVGQFKPNAFGLHDMHGNAWEWCADYYAGDYYPSSPRQDPQGPNTGAARVIRGGSWFDPPYHCRSARRLSYAPAICPGNLGFRVVCVP
jgi:formylglycine-generating enzyme required for sulfatase activity